MVCGQKTLIPLNKQERFKDPNPHRPKFHSSLFRKLNVLDARFLESSFTLDEIKEAVWNCSSSKSPGPDGLNFKFIKRYWEVLKHDFFKCLKHFEDDGNFSRGCNPLFIVLIPKNADPLELSDYLPISLIGCVYKIVSEILSSRLAKVISNLISPNQTSFLTGRQILDGNLIANEITKYAEIEGQTSVV